ncbi:MAG: hypothetical protein AAF623_17655, partial [Planctomycetota bacterium]
MNPASFRQFVHFLVAQCPKLMAALVLISVTFVPRIVACPFCSAVSLTFAEQLDSNDIAVVAKLIEIPPVINDPDADFPKATFEILKILKGTDFVKQQMTFRTQLVGTYPLGQKF